MYVLISDSEVFLISFIYVENKIHLAYFSVQFILMKFSNTRTSNSFCSTTLKNSFIYVYITVKGTVLKNLTYTLVNLIYFTLNLYKLFPTSNSQRRGNFSCGVDKIKYPVSKTQETFIIHWMIICF